ncbi:MAG: phosphoglycerate kinase [Bacteroidales bacterium]|nr:phosphoglycerate kinase [Bacteroidales bacterium]
MIHQLPLIQEAYIKGKIVLIRVDHNVVKKGEIHDPYRIDATLGTLYYIVSRGGKLIIMTHVGRPRDKRTNKITIDENTSVDPIVRYFENKLHVRFVVPQFFNKTEYGYMGIETSINHLIRELKEEKIDGIYLPNTRWFAGEEDKGDKFRQFAYQLAGLADVFVNDAFGSWQPHASTVGVNEFLPSYAGFLMQKEIQNLERIFNPQRPFLAVVAGAKFDTKIEPLYALLQKADFVFLGGVMYNAYLAAKYGFKIKGLDHEDIEQAKKFVEFQQQFPHKLIELPYIIESDVSDNKIDGKWRIHDIRTLPPGCELNYIYDVARKSFEEESIRNIFHQAKTIFVNAVMGYAPYYTEGTIALDELIDENKDAIKLYGGGDTLQELKRLLPGLYIVALDHPKYHIFTGGGAVLKAIEQGTAFGLSPIKALVESKK